MNSLNKFAGWVLGIVIPIVLIWGGIAVYRLVVSNVWIYVDNGDKERMEVSLDDGTPISVDPGKVGILKTRGGSHRVKVQRGGKTVFDETREWKAGDPAKWVLNPGKTRRYWKDEVRYGLAMPKFSSYSSQVDRYQKIAQQIELVEPAELFEVECDYVLEPPPKTVTGRHTDSRTVLRRIDTDDHALLAAASKKTAATEEDCHRLDAVVKRILDKAD